jgi:hypothetical protein
MTHGVLIQNKVAAMNVDSYNRSAVCASDVDNGNVVVLSAKSATAGQSEVWTALVPTTSNGLTGLWMAYSPEVVVTDSKYKGLDVDPRNFTNTATYVFDVFKPQLGDVVTMSTDCLAGTYLTGTTTHVNATDSTGALKLLWGNSQTGSVLSLKFLAVTYISVGTGTISNQRLAAYQFEVVGL